MDRNKQILGAVGIIGGIVVIYLLTRKIGPTDTATLKGTVNGYDEATGTTYRLPGATVTVAETWSAVSDAEGRYEILGIEPGDHPIIAECPGYGSRLYDSWTFEANQTRSLTIHLLPL